MVDGIAIEQLYLTGQEIKIVWDAIELITEGEEPDFETNVRKIKLSAQMDVINDLILLYQKQKTVE